jgi:hypothetical protein
MIQSIQGGLSMKWSNLREHYPNQWVLFEALEAYSQDGKRIVESLSFVDTFENSRCALDYYNLLHQKNPERELYVDHTSKKQLDLYERKWLGVRV